MVKSVLGYLKYIFKLNDNISFKICKYIHTILKLRNVVKNIIHYDIRTVLFILMQYLIVQWYTDEVSNGIIAK